MKIHPKWDNFGLISGRAKIGFIVPAPSLQSIFYLKTVFGDTKSFTSVEDAKSSVKPEYEAFWSEGYDNIRCREYCDFMIRLPNYNAKIGGILVGTRDSISFAMGNPVGFHSDLESAKEFLKEYLGAS